MTRHVSLTYAETDAFYEALDAAAKKGSVIQVSFADARLTEDSKLWRRLRKCENWEDIQAQLERVARGDDGAPLRAVVSTGMAAGLSTGVILLIAWCATLLVALLFYAVYEDYEVHVEGEVEPYKGRGKIILRPRRKPKP